MNVALITCTRDRPEALALCIKYIARQTFTDFTWIVVDDGDVAASGLPNNAALVRRSPSTKRNTLPENLLGGLRVAQDRGADTIALMEDD